MRLLLADENFPQPSVEALRTYGWDVLTILAAGLAEQAFPDEEVLKFATEQDRAVLTLNRKDFIKLHKIVTTHSGIVVCTLDFDFARLAQNVIKAIEQEGDLNNKLIRVTKG